MKKKIKISFIGCGFMSQIAHICNFYKDKRVELFDVADFDLKMAQGVKKKFGFKGVATTNADKVIRNKPDGIVIIVQRPLMTNLIKKSFKNNLNVMSEKPPSYSSKEYLNCEKISKDRVWIKGYNRRCDPVVRNFKKELSEYSKKFGKLINVKYEILLGNSYLGAKHKVKPSLKKKRWNGIKNKFPTWLKGKNRDLYEYHLNSGCHYFDMFDFLNIFPKKNFNSTINEKIFYSSFEAKFKKDLIKVNLSIINSRVAGWEESLVFMFDKGNCRINFGAPLNKKESHKLIINDGLNGRKKIFVKKNCHSFLEQSKMFVNLISNVKTRKEYSDFKDGKNSLIYYENVWKKYLKQVN